MSIFLFGHVILSPCTSHIVSLHLLFCLLAHDMFFPCSCNFLSLHLLSCLVILGNVHPCSCHFVSLVMLFLSMHLPFCFLGHLKTDLFLFMSFCLFASSNLTCSSCPRSYLPLSFCLLAPVILSPCSCHFVFWLLSFCLLATTVIFCLAHDMICKGPCSCHFVALQVLNCLVAQVNVYPCLCDLSPCSFHGFSLHLPFSLLAHVIFLFWHLLCSLLGPTILSPCS